MTAPLFYAELSDADEVTLRPEDARHAAGAMRLRAGEVVLVGDGVGRVATCRVVTAHRRDVVVAIEEVMQVPAVRDLTVVQAIPKGERGDLAVELLTETGASRIVPWMSARTVADWRHKETAKADRWRRVAKAAAMQSRRAYLPEVTELLTRIPVQPTFVLHEDAPTSLFDLDLPPGPITVVVGPEGGLTTDEVMAMGGTPVLLGPTILRTSTAGAAACVWIRGVDRRGQSATRSRPARSP